MPYTNKRSVLTYAVVSFGFGFICACFILNTTKSIDCAPRALDAEAVLVTPQIVAVNKKEDVVETTSKTETKAVEKDFYSIAQKYGTDKTAGRNSLKTCLSGGWCPRPNCTKVECRSWGHWYQTIYQPRIGKYSVDTIEPFQFLEIGFYQGKGYQTYREFLSDTAEVHSMEISCLPEGPRSEGKWPWGNFASKNKNYEKYLKEDRLHCGDASDLEFLDKIWNTKMHRPGAPPLRIVVDDGAHVNDQMAQTMFFWFPRIEPGGLLIVEDIQPTSDSNKFRTQFLPQMISDLHFCGDPKYIEKEPCFPLLQSLLHSIHCEMHICIFERNQKPALPDLPLEESQIPSHALNAMECPSIRNRW